MGSASSCIKKTSRSRYYYVIISKINSNEFAYRRTTHLNGMLRQVRSIDTICSLIEDNFNGYFCVGSSLMIVIDEIL